MGATYTYIEISRDGTAWRLGRWQHGPWRPIPYGGVLSGLPPLPTGRPIALPTEIVRELERRS